MNKQSVAHSYVQNQQPSSWIDDPFQLGTHAFKGLKPMSHKRNLEDYVQELVASCGIYCQDHYDLRLEMLTEEEQDQLVHLYIESIDREIEWACYGTDESINSDFLCSMLAMLKLNTKESREEFAETTRRNLLAYYKETLEDLLHTGCELYFRNEMHEAGYRADYCRDNGDVVWGKF
jgi:hypothetical protein